MKLLGDALRLNVPVTGKAFALLALSCTFLMVGQVEAAPQKAASGKAAAKSAPGKGPVKAARPAQGGASQAAIGAYCGRVWAKVAGKWLVPDGNNHVVLTTELASDGSYGDISVTSSPKNQEAEAAAMTALDQSKPLDLLPTGMARGKMTITFDSKADPHGDCSSSGSVRLDPLAAGN